MSHFTVIAIMPKDVDETSETAINEYLSEVLERYDENREVVLYKDECYCVGAELHKEALDVALGPGFDPISGKSLEEYRQWFHTEMYTPRLDEAIKEADNGDKGGDRDPVVVMANEMTKEWRRLTKALFEIAEIKKKAYITERPERNVPNPECTNCCGAGVYDTTYNPESKWDWWVIGGRWCGTLIDPEKGCGCDQWNHNEHWRQNVIKAHELKEGWSCHAMILPDGTWEENGKMGGFGMVSDEDDAWDNGRRQEIMSAFPDNAIVLLDCHI